MNKKKEYGKLSLAGKRLITCNHKGYQRGRWGAAEFLACASAQSSCHKLWKRLVYMAVQQHKQHTVWTIVYLLNSLSGLTGRMKLPTLSPCCHSEWAGGLSSGWPEEEERISGQETTFLPWLEWHYPSPCLEECQLPSQPLPSTWNWLNQVG